VHSAKAPIVRLQHILEHIDGILRATDGLTPEDAVQSFLVIKAVERCAQVISEAAKELPLELRAQEPDVPWQDIIRIGNLLRHEYYRISDAAMLDILFVDLPKLRPAVMRLIEQHRQPS